MTSTMHCGAYLDIFFGRLQWELVLQRGRGNRYLLSAGRYAISISGEDNGKGYGTIIDIDGIRGEFIGWVAISVVRRYI